MARRPEPQGMPRSRSLNRSCSQSPSSSTMSGHQNGCPHAKHAQEAVILAALPNFVHRLPHRQGQGQRTVTPFLHALVLLSEESCARKR
jgi:hypothetical protein